MQSLSFPVSALLNVVAKRSWRMWRVVFWHMWIFINLQIGAQKVGGFGWTGVVACVFLFFHCECSGKTSMFSQWLLLKSYFMCLQNSPVNTL